MIIDLVKQTLTQPQDAARRILGLGLPRETVLQLLGVTVGIRVIIQMLVIAGLRRTSDPDMQKIIEQFLEFPNAGPIVLALIMFVTALVFTALIQQFGNMLGGKGDYWGLLALSTWVDLLMVLAIIVGVILTVLMPPIGALFQLAAVITMIVVLINVISVGLAMTRWKTFFILIASFIALLFVQSLLAPLFF
ncbi:MAG: YIP1 family protein [Halocynthiibacter sp.]